MKLMFWFDKATVDHTVRQLTEEYHKEQFLVLF